MVPLAVVLYLLPVVALFVARARRDRPLWEIAVDVPLAVALDMMLLLLVSRIVPLEIAAFVTRGLEAIAAIAWVALRRRRGDRVAFPRALDARAIGAALGGAAALTLISVTISRTYQVWDRFWHISLVSTIRTQTLPFANVYDPSRPLSYHYSGDAMAAALQALSGLSLHSSHALSLTHDLMFALAGLALGLLLVDWGARGWPVAIVGAVVWVLAGPPSLLRDGGQQWAGYNFVHYLTLSYRPHVSVAGLFVVGVVGVLGARLRRGETPEPGEDRWLRGGVPLFLLISALSVTDEASCAVLGLAVGTAWLVWPELLGPSRKQGIIVLAALAVGLVLANLLFAGLLSPGAERPGMRLVGWRSPGFANPTLPFANGGSKHFFKDVAALLAFGAAFAIAALRARTRPALALAAFVGVLVGVAVFALGRLDMPPKPVEAHRFVTAGMIVCPLAGTFLLCRARSTGTFGTSPLATVLIGLAVAVPAASTFGWLFSPGKTAFQTQASFASTEDFFETNCAGELGVTFGEHPRPTYASKSVLFIYSGCHPTFLSGKSGGHKIRTSSPLQSFDALADMRTTMRGRGDGTLDAVCPAGGGNDPICNAAIARGPCDNVGKTRGGVEIVRCPLVVEDQDRLLANRPAKESKPGKGAPAEPKREREEPDTPPDETEP